MRPSLFLFSQPKQSSARRSQKEPVPFQMLLPLKLKKTVSAKSDRTRDPACMQEMTLMFACFKRTDFDQQQCLKEVKEFTGCFKEYSARMDSLRQQEKQGILVPGEKKLTHRQVNKLMKAYPPKP